MPMLAVLTWFVILFPPKEHAYNVTPGEGFVFRAASEEACKARAKQLNDRIRSFKESTAEHYALCVSADAPHGPAPSSE